MLSFRRTIPALLVLALGAAISARAQIPGAEVTQALVTRGALDSVLQQLDRAANSGVSAEERARARREAARVRERLADGDFRVGDRVLLEVEGETALTDTFTVNPGRELLLPRIGSVSVTGVLRSELADYLTRHLGQFLRDPKVRAQPLIRVTISGAVNRPGFYTVPVDIPISDVFSLAGGLSAVANFERMRIRRGNETLWERQEVLAIITEGRTLDAINVQAGDHFDVAATPSRNAFQYIQMAQILMTIPFTVLGIINLIRN